LEPDLLYVDMHLVHEVTSPQAFDSLRMQQRTVRRPELTLATIDHGVPTANRELGITDPMSKIQIDALIRNCDEFGVTLFGLDDPRSGIVHIIGPEQGITQPGMLIVCGDSHTSTHGAFGALAFGIGTSEVEHVLATQTLPQEKPKAMAIRVEGELPPGVTPKDVILGVIATIGTGGGNGHVIEYMGSTITGLSMEGRMTICNMSIEAGARAGVIAPDDTTFAYMEGRPFAPSNWEAALDVWRQLPTDIDASFDHDYQFLAGDFAPYVSWGTNPGQTIPITGRIPSPDEAANPTERDSIERALAYMDLPGGIPITDVRIDRVFLGSCTNGRRAEDRSACERDGGAGVGPGEATSRVGRARSDLQGGGLRMA
jgi:3-isopropylmalate/(R)-2-methylmalate dehydratase large subunit